MSLRDRLQTTPVAPAQGNSAARSHKNAAQQNATAAKTSEIWEVSTFQKGERFEEMKSKVHALLVDKLNLQPSQEVNKEDVREAARQILDSVLVNERVPMGRQERDAMVQELDEEILGLGPLEPLLRDPTIADILVNGPKQVYIERGGKLMLTTVCFKDNAHLMHIIDRIVSSVGRRVDEKNPMVDSRMMDGSRFNAIIPPLAIDGPSLSIRKFKADAGTMDKLLKWDSMTPEMAATLEAAVKARLNIVVSGGTGAGKTTLLNSLSALIPEDERIVTIEDSAELQLQQEHVVRLETRPANIEGEGAITARELLMNCLRMRPDRIIVGECRGGEALDMLQAMNTGHDGSLTTLHANAPRDAISRIETMCMMNKSPLPEKTIRQQIASAVHVIVQASRLQDGSRKVTSISEVVGMEGSMILLQEIFKFHQTGVDEKGKVIGKHQSCGVRPKFAETMRAHGVELAQELFLTLEEDLPKEDINELKSDGTPLSPMGEAGKMANSMFNGLAGSLNNKTGFPVQQLSKLAANAQDERFLQERLARKT
jgi:pilus assembly protein CpaF